MHVSREQSHEAIRRARQKGMRVYGEPLIQHLLLDEGEYAHDDWDHAARRVMSLALPQSTASGQPLAGLTGWQLAGRGHRSLRFHHRTEALWRW